MKATSFIKIAFFINKSKRALRIKVCCATTCGEKVVRSTKGGRDRRSRKVLKFDGAFGPEGCGIALTGDEFYNAAFGGHVHIDYHNHSYPRTSLRHFVALFP